MEAGPPGVRMTACSPDACIAELTARLGSAAVVTDDAEMAKYQTAARYDDGKAAFVLRPRDAEAVSAAVATCRRHGVTLIAQGANTGLVGAAVPDASGTGGILSLERLEKQIDLDFSNRSVRVSAGMSLLWNSPLGPLRLDIGKALVKESYDQEQLVRFGASTKF